MIKALPFRIGGLLLALTLAVAASGQVTKAGSGYQFRIKFTPGTTIRYKTVISTPLAGKLGSFAMPMSRKVTRVRNNVADLIIKQGPMEFNGRPMGQVTSTTMSVDRLGQAVQGKQSEASGITMFPKGPIRPGFLWTSTLPLPMSGGTGENPQVTAAYRFVKMTTYKAQPAAEISITFTKSGGQIAITGHGTVYIAASDGNMLHSTLKFSVNAQSDMQDASVTAEVSRV